VESKNYESDRNLVIQIESQIQGVIDEKINWLTPELALAVLQSVCVSTGAKLLCGYGTNRERRKNFQKIATQIGNDTMKLAELILQENKKKKEESRIIAP